MFENDYSLAWTAYLAGATGCFLVWCRMTRWMWRWLREVLRILVAILLFTPTLVDPERDLHAPAIAITAMDILFDVGNNAWRAVSDLVLYTLIALGIYLVWRLLRWLWSRHQEDEPLVPSSATNDFSNDYAQEHEPMSNYRPFPADSR